MPKLKHFQQSEGGLVYSTDPDFRPESQADKPNTGPSGPQDLRIHLLRLKGNKVATVVRGHTGMTWEIEELGKRLKQKCGSGGSTKDREIIIQGDHRKAVGEALTKEGHKFKLAGG